MSGRDSSQMPNSSLDWLKKTRADPQKCPEADIRGATERKSRSQPCMGEIVGDEVVNAEDHTTFYDVEEPAYRRSKAKYAHKERERHKEYHYIHRKQQLQIRTTNLYKRLQSHFI